jgi:uncharacterized NAD(P)/FAD-binding protein YdhS
MTRRRVAIIGAGFSGAAVAANLMKRGAAAPDVVLIERGQRFGPGLAYGTREAAHLLNVRASNMSAFPDAPDHFAKWLGGAPTRFVSRAKYGAYAESIVRRANGGWFGPKLRRVRDEAVACERNGEGWSIALASGTRIDADAVVLALGNSAPLAPPALAHLDLIDPWDERGLAALPKGDVLLIGTGLTMIDAALARSKRRKGVIYALSRRGLVPRAHLDAAKPAPPGAIDLPQNLSDALLTLRREAAAIAKRGEPWQFAIDRLRARTPELWRRLTLEQQQRFLRHLRPWWDVHRHRAAPEIAARVAALQKEGRLKVLAGEIMAATAGDGGVSIEYRPRGGQHRRRLVVAGVVNCTGAALDPSLAQNGLTRQLIDDGVVRAHPTRLGFDVDADGRLLAANGAVHANLFALGPITQGAFWESTAVPEIRVRAAAIAMMLAPGR